MLWVLALAIALIAGGMSIMLFHAAFRHGKDNDVRNFLIWAVLFLGASFGSIEWSFYLLGYNMFTFFAFPLVAFFAIWFAFIIWTFEAQRERRVWVAFAIALAIITFIAFNCMNCLA
jgi:hypothetical protein